MFHYNRNMFKKLIEFFTKPKPKQEEILVVFDGDQVSVKLYKRFYDKKTTNIKHIWVHARDTVPKGLPVDQTEVKKAFKFGKESVDKLIAITVTKECALNRNMKEVHIVSGDGDMVDVCATLATEYAHVKFNALHINSRPMKRGIRAFLKTAPSNCNFVSISSC